MSNVKACGLIRFKFDVSLIRYKQNSANEKARCYQAYIITIDPSDPLWKKNYGFPCIIKNCPIKTGIMEIK